MTKQEQLENGNKLKDKIYINWCWKEKKFEIGPAEGKVFIYEKPSTIKPFYKQQTIEILTIKELKEKYGEKCLEQI